MNERSFDQIPGDSALSPYSNLCLLTAHTHTKKAVSAADILAAVAWDFLARRHYFISLILSFLLGMFERTLLGHDFGSPDGAINSLLFTCIVCAKHIAKKKKKEKAGF